MNSCDAGQALAGSINSVLEEMFFASPLEEPSPAAGGGPAPMVARVEFEGALSGRLTMTIAAEAARTMAADFLAEDPEGLSDREVEDVVCELANMLCGSALSRLESDRVFRLEAPSIAPEGEDAACPPAAGHSVELAGGRLTACFHFDPDA